MKQGTFLCYRLFMKYCVFFRFFENILDSGLSLFSLCVSVCTHSRQVEHQRCSRTGRVQKIHRNLRKNTIFNEHPVDNVRDSWSFLTGFLPYLTSVLSRYVNALQPGMLGGPEFWDFRAFSFLFLQKLRLCYNIFKPSELT